MESNENHSTPNRRPTDISAWLIWLIVFIAVGSMSFLMYKRQSGQIEVWMATKDLTAYHLVVNSDVVKTTWAISDLPVEALSANTSPVGGYTLQSIESGRALVRNDVAIPVDSQITASTIPLVLPATEMMTYNRQLRSGAIVDIWLVRPFRAGSSKKSDLILQHVWVIDVQQIEGPIGNNDYPYSIVLAVPQAYADKLITDSTPGSLVITMVP